MQRRSDRMQPWERHFEARMAWENATGTAAAVQAWRHVAAAAGASTIASRDRSRSRSGAGGVRPPTPPWRLPPTPTTEPPPALGPMPPPVPTPPTEPQSAWALQMAPTRNIESSDSGPMQQSSDWESRWSRQPTASPRAPLPRHHFTLPQCYALASQQLPAAVPEAAAAVPAAAPVSAPVPALAKPAVPSPATRTPVYGNYSLRDSAVPKPKQTLPKPKFMSKPMPKPKPKPAKMPKMLVPAKPASLTSLSCEPGLPTSIAQAAADINRTSRSFP